MIESVCEGAECLESCIAVSGLFQARDKWNIGSQVFTVVPKHYLVLLLFLVSVMCLGVRVWVYVGAQSIYK